LRGLRCKVDMLLVTSRICLQNRQTDVYFLDRDLCLSLELQVATFHYTNKCIH